MNTYRGVISATPEGETVRLEGALAEVHPEFRGESAVTARVIGPGQLLVSVVEVARSEADDPLATAFLSMLEADMLSRPSRVRPLDETRLQNASLLVDGVEASDDETLPDDVSL